MSAYKHTVQVYCTGMGWCNTRHGGNTAAEVKQAEAALLANDDAWLSGERQTRIVRTEFTGWNRSKGKP